MLASAVITLLLGALSWHFVEKRFLRRKPAPAAVPQFNSQEMAIK
jgi:peptidoglycan/LPS O-acetylase OafA/YrhL